MSFIENINSSEKTMVWHALFVTPTTTTSHLYLFIFITTSEYYYGKFLNILSEKLKQRLNNYSVGLPFNGLFLCFCFLFFWRTKAN